MDIRIEPQYSMIQTKRRDYLKEWKSEIIYTENKMIFLKIVKLYYILELKVNILNQYNYIFIACLFTSIESIFNVLILLIKKVIKKS